MFLKIIRQLKKNITVKDQKYVTGSSCRPFHEKCYVFFTIFRGKFVYVTRNISAPTPYCISPVRYYYVEEVNLRNSLTPETNKPERVILYVSGKI